MSGIPRSPKLTRAGLVLIEPESGAIERINSLQYACESLQRTLQVRATEDESGRSGPGKGGV